MEVETRLQESLERGAWAEIEPRLTPRARALGRLVGFLATELTAYSQPSEQAEYLRAGIARLFERLDAPVKLRGPEHDAEMMADYWWLRMMNAHERTQEAGIQSPVTAEQRALLEIREAILPSAVAATVSSQRSRKERK